MNVVALEERHHGFKQKLHDVWLGYPFKTTNKRKLFICCLNLFWPGEVQGYLRCNLGRIPSSSARKLAALVSPVRGAPSPSPNMSPQEATYDTLGCTVQGGAESCREV